MALWERAIRILTDKEIAARVPQESWDEIVIELSRNLRQSSKGAAIAAAVERCGHLLAENRVPRRDDDQDELDNEPRLSDD